MQVVLPAMHDFSFFSLHGSKFLIAAVCVAMLVIAWQLTKAAKKTDSNDAAILAGQWISPTVKACIKIEVFQRWVVITMPDYYEVVDMGVLLEFLRGDLFREDRINFIVYDCAQWRSSNVLGLELCQPQFESNWKGEVVFCGAEKVKPILLILLDATLEIPGFRPPRFFDTLAEGLEYATEE